MPSKKDEIESGNPEAGNVDQIREILFGGHLRAFDERFELVESRLGKKPKHCVRPLIRKLRICIVWRLKPATRPATSLVLNPTIGI